MQLFLTAFQSVPDPRAANVRHDLAELLIIAFLAVLCGATCCVPAPMHPDRSFRLIPIAVSD